jgi:hypothetical protein
MAIGKSMDLLEKELFFGGPSSTFLGIFSAARRAPRRADGSEKIPKE